MLLKMRNKVSFFSTLYHAPHRGQILPPPLLDFLDSSKTAADLERNIQYPIRNQFDVFRQNFRKKSVGILF